MADGHAVTVLPSEASLTPAEAAELLGLSRPFVVRLLDEGDIPSQRLPEAVTAASCCRTFETSRRNVSAANKVVNESLHW